MRCQFVGPTIPIVYDLSPATMLFKRAFLSSIAGGAFAFVLLRGLINLMRGGAEPVPEADAMAGAAAMHRDRHHHADGVGDGALKR